MREKKYSETPKALKMYAGLLQTLDMLFAAQFIIWS